jgi:hypothetical protein
MTIEHKIVVGLNDIKTISYECRKCGARAAFPLGAQLEPNNVCYSCRDQWRKEESSVPWVSKDESAFMRFLKALNDIRTLEKEGAIGFRVILEFDEASSREGA